MKILSFVGGHDIAIYENCVFRPEVRKFGGGTVKCIIPYSGRMLNAKVSQEYAEPVILENVEIPTMTPQIFTDVDPVPDESECDFCIVSAMYVAACRSLGVDTSRLLTIGTPVVDESGRVVGITNLCRN